MKVDEDQGERRQILRTFKRLGTGEKGRNGEKQLACHGRYLFIYLLYPQGPRAMLPEGQYFPGRFNGEMELVLRPCDVDFQARTSGESQFVFKFDDLKLSATFIRETGLTYGSRDVNLPAKFNG